MNSNKGAETLVTFDGQTTVMTNVDKSFDPNNNNQNNTGHNESSIKLCWNDLTYEIFDRKSRNDQIIYDNKSSTNIFKDKRRRKLLRSLNGQICTGTITALIGPSGAGKTTLLECISGRYRLPDENMVEIRTKNYSKSIESIRIAYLSHSDTLLPILTVEETLLFGSKLMLINENNRNKLKSKQITHDLLTKLNLNQCRKTRVSNCSNGQCKRLNIALELLFSPTILLLDEPTSGLDSITCEQTIQVLCELIADNQSLAIMLSIHQPTASLLKYFDYLYVMANDGHCIYQGKSNEMIQYLNDFNIQCPTYHNPADFIVEIGLSNDRELIERLAAAASTQRQSIEDEAMTRFPLRKIVTQSKSSNQNLIIQLKQLYQLWKRSIIVQYRNPSEILLRLCGTIIVMLIIWTIYSDMNLGKSNDCFHQQSMIRDLITENLENNQTFDRWLPVMMIRMNRNQFNYAFLFFIEMFIAFISTLPVLLTFPSECIVIRRELLHNWYNLSIYFLAKNIVTIIPTLALSLASSSIVFWLTDQPAEPIWRFVYFNVILVLIALVGDGVGQLISAIFIYQPNQALIFAALSQMGLILFSGLFVPNSLLPFPLKYLTYVSHYRLAFESLIITIYGFDRCPNIIENMDNYSNMTNDELMVTMIRKKFPLNYFKCFIKEVIENNYTIFNWIDNIFGSHHNDNDQSINDNQIESNSSITLNSFNLTENDLYFNIYLLILFIFIYRLLAYWVLYHQMKL